jgi:hypothetical protein
MRSVHRRFSSIGGALLAIAVVLAIALHISEQIRDSTRATGGSSTIAAVGVREQEPIAAPALTVLDRADATDRSRARLVVRVVVPQGAGRTQIEAELGRLAESIYRDNPRICAIAILGYSSVEQRTSSGDNAPWLLTWSPDGLGWAGDARNDFDKHIIATPAP